MGRWADGRARKTKKEKEGKRLKVRRNREYGWAAKVEKEEKKRNCRGEKKKKQG
jgi:hypothetical protein